MKASDVDGTLYGVGDVVELVEEPFGTMEVTSIFVCRICVEKFVGCVRVGIVYYVLSR